MEHFIESWGYLALFVLTLAQGACVPFPSEVTMLVSGYLASRGQLNLAAVITLGTFGEAVGAFGAYFVARTGGRALVARFGRFVLLTHEDLDRVQRWFDHRGEWSVLVGRVVPLVRTFIPIPAGVAGMNPVRFVALSASGSLLWLGTLAGVGYGLGDRWTRITHGFKTAGYALGALVVLAVLALAAHRFLQLRRQRSVTR